MAELQRYSHVVIVNFGAISFFIPFFYSVAVVMAGIIMHTSMTWRDWECGLNL